MRRFQKRAQFADIESKKDISTMTTPYVKVVTVIGFHGSMAQSNQIDRSYFLLIRTITLTKGQLISKCSFGVFKSHKKATNFFPGFLP